MVGAAALDSGEDRPRVGRTRGRQDVRIRWCQGVAHRATPGTRSQINWRGTHPPPMAGHGRSGRTAGASLVTSVIFASTWKFGQPIHVGRAQSKTCS
jgi:hypothetical protein